jgi:hypothetical protein
MPAFRIRNKNVLFIHVPKTGGTTVECFLEMHGKMSLHNQGVKLLIPRSNSALTRSLPLQHFHAELLEAMFAPDFFDYTFMIVRDPLERLKSEYRHSRALGRLDTRLSFEHWVQLMLGLSTYAPNLRNNHFRPQSQFRCFNAEVFKLEDGMEHILASVCTRVGIPVPGKIPHERKMANTAIEVTPTAKAKVRAIYDSDYREFAYGVPNERG